MANMIQLPPDGSVFDKDTGCTLDTCPVDRSIYTYRPALAAGVVFVVLFGLSMILHGFQGLRYKTWWFSGCMILGCICEIIGYGGRIMLWENPFSFNGFIIQIVTITIAPVFFTASIYITLDLVIRYLGVQYSRFPPKFYLWVFVPCDIIALVLQGTGGGLSASGNTPSDTQTGVNISIAGLSFQVATLSIFVLLALDYFVRYTLHQGYNVSRNRWTGSFTLFFIFLNLATFTIFARCAYRIVELKGGYGGKEFHKQWVLLGLESVLVSFAAFALNVAHPRPVLRDAREAKEAMDEPSKLETAS